MPSSHCMIFYHMGIHLQNTIKKIKILDILDRIVEWPQVKVTGGQI